MERTLRIMTTGGAGGDRAETDALIAACGLPPSAAMPVEAAHLVTALEACRGAPVVLLADALTPELAALSHRFGVPVSLVAHGAPLLRLAIQRALETSAWLDATRAADRVRALVHVSVSDVLLHLAVEGDRFRFVEINPAFTRATGLTEDQVVGKYVDDVIPEPSLSLVLGHYREAVRELRTVRWDEITDYPTGRKYGEVSVTPIVDAEGRCTSLLGTVADVTEARRARALDAGEQRILEMVASGASLAATLAALVELVESLTPQAIGSVWLLDPDGVRLRAGAAPGLPEAFTRALDGVTIGPGSGACGAAVARRQPVIVTDIATDPLWADHQELAGLAGVRACWSTPILASDGRVLGTFALYYRTPRGPTSADLELLARIARIAGITLQRHELDEQLHQLSARVEAAREDERTGIAREIHDQLGQALTVLKMDLAWIVRRAGQPDGLTPDVLRGKLAELLDQADQLIAEVRRISAELRPGVLDDLGLDAAIAWEAQEFTRRTQVECTVRSGLADGERIARDVATAVFRVFQEALTNVVRHAEARRVDVWLDRRDGALELQVRDDGKGIPAEAILDPRALGLVGIRERARRLAGTATFARGEQGGTVVTLRVPLT